MPPERNTPIGTSDTRCLLTALLRRTFSSLAIFFVGAIRVISFSGSQYACNEVRISVSHNTVQFDDRDQMPKLGRFLFGNWLKTKHVSSIAASDSRVSCSASYRDYRGAEHFREINLNSGSLSIFDEIKGFKKKAVIRWRLTESEWILENTKNGVQVSNGLNTLSVTSDVPILRADLVDGFKSLFYMQKQSVPVLEVEIGSAGTISTEFSWAS